MNLIKRFVSNGRKRPIFGNPIKATIEPVRLEPEKTAVSSFYLNQNPVLTQLLSHNKLIFERQIEYMNLFLSFEQHNKYAIYDINGMQLGWMIERETSFFHTILRQLYRTHRPFCIDLMDMQGNIGLTVKRGFRLLNSHVKVLLPISRDINELNEKFEIDKVENALVLGESIQKWHLWRRRYELFANEGKGDMEQIGYIDAPLFAWDFPIGNSDGNILGMISRTFKGIFREVLTDTGVYEVDMGSFKPADRPALIGLCVSIDFDFFSRHSTSGSPVNYVE